MDKDIKIPNGLTQRIQETIKDVRTTLDGLNFCTWVNEPEPAVRREEIDKALSRIAPWYEISQKQEKVETLDKNREKVYTKRMAEYFPKAIEAGFMERSEDGFKWLYNGGSKVSLFYFLKEVYSPDGRIPYKSLEQLFHVKRLDSTKCGFDINKNTQKWEGGIDGLFKE